MNCETAKKKDKQHLQRITDGFLEMVDGDEVRKEWQHVFDLYQIALLQETHGLFDVVFTTDDVLGCKIQFLQ